MNTKTKTKVPFERASRSGPFPLSAFRERTHAQQAQQAEAMHPAVPIEAKEVATYEYVDAKGTLLFRVHRYDPKTFSQSRPDGGGQFGARMTLYRLPAVLEAENVLILEGEKDVDTAYRLGLPPGWAATTNAGGAGKWSSEYSELLRGKKVTVCPDQDPAGWQHLRQVVIDLLGKAADLRVITLAEPAKDLSDWAEAGGTQKELAQLLANAQPVDAAF